MSSADANTPKNFKDVKVRKRKSLDKLSAGKKEKVREREKDIQNQIIKMEKRPCDTGLDCENQILLNLHKMQTVPAQS